MACAVGDDRLVAQLAITPQSGFIVMGSVGKCCNQGLDIPLPVEDKYKTAGRSLPR